MTVVNCDRCGRFCAEEDSGDRWNFCDDCWHARLHRYGPEWWAIRRRALQRDNYRCQQCGMSQPDAIERYGEALSVHHIRPYDDGGTHQLSNLVTLCKACHARTEGFS